MKSITPVSAMLLLVALNFQHPATASYDWAWIDDQLSGSPVIHRDTSIAIFDSGVIAALLPNVTSHDFTPDRNNHDFVGHGTFVAGMYQSVDMGCPGMLPDAQITSFKVVDHTGLAKDSYLTEAIDYVLTHELHFDFVSISFDSKPNPVPSVVAKLQQLVDRGMLLVVSAGNDGPLYGSIMEPGNMLDVITVGAYDATLESVARYSSRGFDNVQLVHNMSAIKPDVLALGGPVKSLSSFNSQCVQMQGTSFAVPHIIKFLATARRHLQPFDLYAAHQLLSRSCMHVVDHSVPEQGYGHIDVRRFVQKLLAMVERQPARASDSDQLLVRPHYIDTTERPCLNHWPFCTYTFYESRLPQQFNLTVADREWVRGDSQSNRLTLQSVFLTQIECDHDCPPMLEQTHLRVTMDQQAADESTTLLQTVMISIEVVQPVAARVQLTLNLVINSQHNHQRRMWAGQNVRIRLELQPTPPPQQRLLFDVYHQRIWPYQYVPNDYMPPHSKFFKSQLEYVLDHPFANYQLLYDYLINKQNYHVEILTKPLVTVDLTQYGVLLLSDVEAELSDGEQQKIHTRLAAPDQPNFCLWIVGEWYEQLRIDMQFLTIREFEISGLQTTVGGFNLPSVNQLLAPYELEFGTHVAHGRAGFPFNDITLQMAGQLVKWPPQAFVRRDRLMSVPPTPALGSLPVDVTWMAWVPLPQPSSRILMMADSSALENNVILQHGLPTQTLNYIFNLVHNFHNQTNIEGLEHVF